MWQHIRQGMATRRKQKAKQKTTSTNSEKEEEKKNSREKTQKKQEKITKTEHEKTGKKHETFKIHNPGLWLVKNLIRLGIFWENNALVAPFCFLF